MLSSWCSVVLQPEFSHLGTPEEGPPPHPAAPRCRRSGQCAGLGKRLLSIGSAFVDFRVTSCAGCFRAISSFPFFIFRSPVLHDVLIYFWRRPQLQLDTVPCGCWLFRLGSLRPSCPSLRSGFVTLQVYSSAAYLCVTGSFPLFVLPNQGLHDGSICWSFALSAGPVA